MDTETFYLMKVYLKLKMFSNKLNKRGINKNADPLRRLNS